MDNNYYQEIIGKINTFIANKNYEQALMIVKEELQIAYIPQFYLEQFISLKQEIVNNIAEQNTHNNNQLWTIEKITNTIQNNHDEGMHTTAFFHLQNHNVRLILPVIKNYLINSENSAINKTQLLYLLQSQDISESFQVNKNHKSFQVVPTLLTFWKAAESYQKVSKLLQQNVLMDNPGIYEICDFLLNRYYQSLIPDIPIIKHSNAVAAAIYIRACSLQFIKVTLILSANKFHSTTKLTKKYLLDINQHNIA